ncbi:MAG: DUF167 domain-containing protein [Candidatus Aenigmarchaeota archaeon]|nr:DUF167 domain-containing protein [Candidatus Aenigmarchaeota archaeon]
MLFSLKVIPNSKKLEIMRFGENEYKIKLDVHATEGKANIKLIQVIADYFHVPKSSVSIIRGFKSRNKIVEVL